jgi:hypothetical protein
MTQFGLQSLYNAGVCIGFVMTLKRVRFRRVACYIDQEQAPMAGFIP